MLYLDLFLYDEMIRARHGDLVCGVDEAGRGPLAGPVACAAVILPQGVKIEALTDSKKMTEKQRDKVFEEITEVAVSFSVILVDNEEIDRINILQATMQGMKRAVYDLNISPDYVLIDGNRVPNTLECAESVIKGDGISASIAAASVVAKVTRDRFMLMMDEVYPEYRFAQHKGYPTKLHYEMIDIYGVTPIHRRSFLKGRV